MVQRSFFLFVFVWLVLFPGPVFAAEVIHGYYTQIKVLSSGDLEIRETITVTAEGDQIRHGIYRDLPLFRTMLGGGVLPMDYEIRSIRRDGRTEPYHTTTDEGAFLRIYIGDASYYLPTGRRYTYEITYCVKRQIFFFDGFDQLYWNAIGTGWVFPIEDAKVQVYLPGGATPLNYNVYTGYALSTDGEYRAEQQQDGILTIAVTRRLEEHEGVTVKINFPKGIVQVDPSMTGFMLLLREHSGLPLMLGLFVVLFAYYYRMWDRIGRDPKGKPIIPQYSPPEGISPAMAADILTMGSAGTRQTLTAAIVSLASKGYLTIEQSGKRHITSCGLSPTRAIMNRSSRMNASFTIPSIPALSSSRGTRRSSSRLHCIPQPWCVCAKNVFIISIWAGGF